MTSSAAQPTEQGTAPGGLRARAQDMTSRLPTVRGGDLIFYGGLGALTVAGALEWPVALAIGGAAYVVKSGRAHQEAKAGAGETAESPATSRETEAEARRAG